jgi:uncharacterized protein YbjT (DUF2867 family)
VTGHLVLVTGANGYIASRLIPRLLRQGYRVRALARRPERLAGRPWLEDVEAVRGSTRAEDELARSLQGVHTAYYLIHSMASGRGYVEVERESARRFASAADTAGVQHIVYLGGLADPRAKNLAPHMRSRIETGEMLRQGRVPVTEFRGGVIVGAGSISFEMIRFLTECFPILPGPNWLRNQAQPIAASNVVDYLVAALERPERRGGIYEMGGPDRMQYAETMLRYARSRKLKRLLFTLPGVPIWFMARVVDWLTPVPYPIATALVGGLQSDSMVLDDSARQRFPEVDLIPYERAVRLALEDLAPARLERVWEGLERDAVRMRHEGFFIDYRRAVIDAPSASVFARVARIGAAGRWPYANWLWRLRAWVDGLFSTQYIPRVATEMNRVMRSPASAEMDNPGLEIGQMIDRFRVEALQPGRLLRLHSQLQTPGDGWMEWRVEAHSPRMAVLTQTVFFAPRGLPGFLYWLLLGPLHQIVFGGLVRAIKRRSESA